MDGGFGGRQEGQILESYPALFSAGHYAQARVPVPQNLDTSFA